MSPKKLPVNIREFVNDKERTGFEPAREQNPLAGFRVRCRTKLGHLSMMINTKTDRQLKNAEKGI